MLSKLSRPAFALFALTVSLRAAETTPGTSTPAPAASTTAAEPAAPDIEKELNELRGRINKKIQAGVRNTEGMTDELKAFDEMLAKHQGEKTEAVAVAAYMRALLYVQIFHDYDRGGTLMKEVETQYPGTNAASGAAHVNAQLETMKEGLKVQAALKPGAAFPDFDEKDLAGQPVSIGKYKGKVVLVDFWATWCGPCVAELPNVLAAYEKYHAKGFEIVGISLDQDEKRLKDFLADKKMTWQQYFDGQGWNSKLGKKYGVQSIPATFLLDRDGKVIASDLRGEALDAELEKQLGK